MTDPNIGSSQKSPGSTQAEFLQEKNSLKSQLMPILTGKKQTSLANLFGNNSLSPKTSSLNQNEPDFIEEKPRQFLNQEKRSQSAIGISVIQEGNENSEQSVNLGNKSTSKIYPTAPIYRFRRKREDGPRESIRPNVTDKFTISSSSNQSSDKFKLINIAGIRNKQSSTLVDQKMIQRETFGVPQEHEMNEASFKEDQLLINLSQSKSSRNLKTQKESPYKNVLLRNMNKIKNNETNKLQRHQSKQMSEASPSLFDLANEITFNGKEQDLEVPSGLLDDSDFVTHKQRYELLRRRKMKKKSQALKSPGKRLRERQNILTRHDDSDGEYESEDDEKDKIVIDVRHLKPAPNYQKEYISMSVDDVLPAQKERQMQQIEEADKRNIRESRLKLMYKITRSDQRKAKDRLTSVYTKSEKTPVIPVQSTIITARIRRERLEREALEEELNQAREREEFGSITRNRINHSLLKNLSRRRTGYRASVHVNGSRNSIHASRASGHLTTGGGIKSHKRFNEEDYLPVDKMDDYIEISKRIQKPFSNEAEIDNQELEAKKIKEFNYSEEFRNIRVIFFFN